MTHVTQTCELCDNTYRSLECIAEHTSEKGVPATCSMCRQRIEELWTDMYIRGQVSRVRLMADYLAAYGYESKAQSLRVFADAMESYESVIRAANKCDALSDRETFEQKIKKYDEA